MDVVGYLDLSRLTGGLQPSRRVDGVAEEAVAGHFTSEHAGHCRSCVDAYHGQSHALINYS